MRLDLTRPAVNGIVKKLIVRWDVFGVMLDPPCSSFSVLGDLRGTYRGAVLPEGRPDLCVEARAKVEAGHVIAAVAGEIFALCVGCRVPAILGSPGHSLRWNLPLFEKLRNTTCVYTVISDQCGFGTAWRKSATFLIFGIDFYEASSRLGMRCIGRLGFCDHTGRAHVHVEGRTHDGVKKTRPFPELPAKARQDVGVHLRRPRACKDIL